MLLYLILVLALVVAAEVPQRDKTCQPGESCLPTGDCPYWREKEDLKNSLRGRDRQAIVEQQKNQICNKRARALCCPPCKESSCLPVSQCPAVQQLQAQRAAYKRQRNAAGAQRLLEQIKGLICNKREKLLCCPPAKESLLPNLEEECGVSGRAASVVGGKNSEPGEYPWAALLGNKRTTKRRINGRTHTLNQTRWSCGGILITRRFVLTAAHCQGRKESSRLAVVRLGEYSVEGYGGETSSSGGQLPPEQDFEIGPNDVIVHEDYQTKVQGKFRNILNDIALIRLPREARLNDGVHLVCLPKWPAEYRPELEVKNLMRDLEGRTPTVVGWGYTSGFDPWSGEAQGDIEKYGVGSQIQQKLELPLLEPAACTEKYDGFQPDTSQICAGGVKGKDSCKGDSGGGLYIQRHASNTRPWYLIGIVSFGSKSCGSGRPGVYTRVSEFIPWIEENMAKL